MCLITLTVNMCLIADNAQLFYNLFAPLLLGLYTVFCGR